MLHKIRGAALDPWILFNWLGKIDLKFFFESKAAKALPNQALSLQSWSRERGSGTGLAADDAGHHGATV